MVCHKTYQDSDKKWVYPEEVIKESEEGRLFHKVNQKRNQRNAV